jgi:hypothetical protein
VWGVNLRRLKRATLVVTSLALPTAAAAATVGNLLCPGEEVLFNPGNGEDIVVPDGFKVSVFASGLNFPTGIAFRGDSHRFEVYVLESGVFPTSRCNDGVAWQSKGLPGNPFTPDIRVYDQRAKLLRTLGKAPDASTETAGAFSPKAVVDIAFEYGLAGGRLFATDNASDGGRIVTVDPMTGKVIKLITGLPAGPTGQLAFQGGLDLLGRRRHDEQRGRQQIRWRPLWATRRPVPGHCLKPERVRFRRRDFDQRLFAVRSHEPGWDRARVFQRQHRQGATGRVQRRGPEGTAGQYKCDRPLLVGLPQRLRNPLCAL